MSFQKCPVCNGTGKSTTSQHSNCHVCEGHGIISELTGRPPLGAKNSKEEKTPEWIQKLKEKQEKQNTWPYINKDYKLEPPFVPTCGGPVPPDYICDNTEKDSIGAPGVEHYVGGEQKFI